MPKKFKGENSKAVVAIARKAEAAAEKRQRKTRQSKMNNGIMMTNNAKENGQKEKLEVMPKKFKGENSKAVVAIARKAEAAAEKRQRKTRQSKMNNGIMMTNNAKENGQKGLSMIQKKLPEEKENAPAKTADAGYVEEICIAGD